MTHALHLPGCIHRCARIALHVGRGLATTLLVFPWRDSSARHTLTQRWSQDMLRILQVTCRVQGAAFDALPGDTLVVANHISWLDVVVLNAVRPMHFIAKAELRRWPVLGLLCQRLGTLFIVRGSRRDMAQVHRQLVRRLSQGQLIGLFPEGTTSDGQSVQKFHTALLQSVIDVGGHIQPVAIRYRDAVGQASTAAAYIGDTGFLTSLWRIVRHPHLEVALVLPTRLPAASGDRRKLAEDARSAIEAALKTPHPPAASRQPTDGVRHEPFAPAFAEPACPPCEAASSTF